MIIIIQQSAVKPLQGFHEQAVTEMMGGIMGEKARHAVRNALICNLWAKEAPAKEIVAAVELAKKVGTLPERTMISVWVVYNVVKLHMKHKPKKPIYSLSVKTV